MRKLEMSATHSVARAEDNVKASYHVTNTNVNFAATDWAVEEKVSVQYWL